MQIVADSKRLKVLCFGPYRLETPNGMLLFNGRPVQIPPRALAVLRLLVESNGGLVTKEDLIEKVWSGAFIEESNITKSIAEIRRILRPGFKQVDPIRTIWKQGYRFAVPVTSEIDEPTSEPIQALPADDRGEVAASSIQAVSLPNIPPQARAIPWIPMLAVAILCGLVVFLTQARPLGQFGHPKVAILNIRNISNDGSVDWMGTALAETLTSELQAGTSLPAISADRVSQMRTDLGLPGGVTYDPATLQRIKANLGCQLAVTGTFLTTGNALRLDLHIHDTATGETRGSVSETGAADNLLDLVARAGTDLRRVLGAQSAPRPELRTTPVNSDALRLYAEGMEHLRTWDARGAQDLFTRALETGDTYAPIHAGLSLDWSLLGFDQRAREEARRALDAATGLPREQQLQIEAQFAEAGADWPKAIETWRALWRFYPDQTDYAERLATALTSGGKAAEAVTMLRNLRSTDPRLLLANARASFALSDYAAAAGHSTSAIEQARKVSARLMESRALAARSEALTRLSEYDKAHADIREAGRISAALGDRSGYAESLYREAAIARFWGEGVNKEELLQQALAIAGEIGNRHLSRTVLNELTNLHRNHTDMAGALKVAEQALAIARETADGNGEATTLIDMGNLLNNTGQPGRARETYSQALTRGAESGNRRVMSMALGNLGILDYASGDLARAISGMQKALELKRQIGDRDSIAYTLNYLGRVSISAGKLGEARRYLEESEAMLKSIGEMAVSPAMNFAQLDIIEGRPEKAEQPLTALGAKLERPSPKCEILYILAESWLARGNLEKAREVNAQALALAAKSPNRGDFGIPAELIAARIEMAAGHYDRAYQQMNTLLAEARKLNHVPLELSIRYAIECLEKNRGNLRAASEAGRSLQRDAERMGFGLIASSTQRVDTLAVLRPPTPAIVHSR